ncbi:hypothetical protein AO073_01875 [Pseudomonas syringae ICMP 11293]|nr:hypothetical protein AO073_01875 [Pseudomonas syringae ICMP 11293]
MPIVDLDVGAAPLPWRLTSPLLDLGYGLFYRWRPQLAWSSHPDGSARCRGDSCAVSKTDRAPHAQ